MCVLCIRRVCLNFTETILCYVGNTIIFKSVYYAFESHSVASVQDYLVLVGTGSI